MNAEKVKPIHYVLPMLAFACIVMQAFNEAFWHDDFNIVECIVRDGFFKYTYDLYLNWDGRVISPLYFARNILLLFTPHLTLPVLAAVSILVTAWFIAKSMELVLKISISFPAVLLLAISIWLGFTSHMARSVYWATGSYYAFANMLIFAWIYYYLKNTQRGLGFLLLTFSVASSGVNAAAVVFIVPFLLHIGRYRKFEMKKEYLTALVFLIAFSFSTFAPGNFMRAENSYKTKVGHDNLIQLFKNFLIVFKEYLFMSKFVIIGGVISGLALYRQQSTNNSALFRTLSIVFLLAGLGSIAPFVFVPDSASKHTAIHFHTLLFISILFFCFYALGKINIKPPAYLFAFLINAMAAFVLFIGIKQFSIGRKVKTDLDKRYALLESKRNTKDTVYLSALYQPPSFFATRIWDIKNPPDNINETLSHHFNTGPVILK